MTTRIVDLSTVIAAAAALWALAFGWVTYVKSVQTQNEDEFAALKSVVTALRTELDFMKGWASDPGYSITLSREEAREVHPDWSSPNRIIFRFSSDAIESLSNSRYFTNWKASSSLSRALSFRFRSCSNSMTNIVRSQTAILVC